MNDTVATEDLEQPAKCHERKARKSDRDPGCRTSSRPAEICSAPTGRTYDRSRPNRLKRQKSACQGRPSTSDFGTNPSAIASDAAQVGSNTVITDPLHPTDTITLAGVSLSSLHFDASHFLLV